MNLRDIVDFWRLPKVTVDLMLEKTADNDPFFAQMTRGFYQEATSRHPKWFLIQKYKHGFAMCPRPKDFDTYYMAIEAAARRNHKKSLRLGYEMKRFDFNLRLEEISAIKRSTPVRQGLLPADIREGLVEPTSNPPSRSYFHDYPYFGIFMEGRLVAYSGCMVAGEILDINDIYGHADFLSDGVVPLLVIEICRELLKSYPAVKYYSYNTYFGAGTTMRRFKRKFLFLPHQVTWRLGHA